MEYTQGQCLCPIKCTKIDNLLRITDACSEQIVPYLDDEDADNIVQNHIYNAFKKKYIKIVQNNNSTVYYAFVATILEDFMPLPKKHQLLGMIHDRISFETKQQTEISASFSFDLCDLIYLFVLCGYTFYEHQIEYIDSIFRECSLIREQFALQLINCADYFPTIFRTMSGFQFMIDNFISVRELLNTDPNYDMAYTKITDTVMKLVLNKEQNLKCCRTLMFNENTRTGPEYMAIGYIPHKPKNIPNNHYWWINFSQYSFALETLSEEDDAACDLIRNYRTEAKNQEKNNQYQYNNNRISSNCHIPGNNTDSKTIELEVNIITINNSDQEIYIVPTNKIIVDKIAVETIQCGVINHPVIKISIPKQKQEPKPDSYNIRIYNQPSQHQMFDD